MSSKILIDIVITISAIYFLYIAFDSIFNPKE